MINQTASISLRIVAIGFVTTLTRVIAQLLIPSNGVNLLPPSVFVLNGTMPLVFSIYALVAFSLIAALFLLLKNQLAGRKITQGLQFGVAYSLIWIAYLLEPLPHAVPLDRITYPVADSFALLVMGLLLGILLGKDKPKQTSQVVKRSTLLPILTITILFMAGRLVQYLGAAE